jgi:hypothetical protein
MWCALLLVAFAPGQGDAFDRHFTGRTLRFDYVHSGRRGEETISPEVVRAEGAWPGSRTQLVDPTNLGKYLFEVVDRSTNVALYTRGFASIYGEWETTAEARALSRAFHESQRFPEPRAGVQLVLKKRADDGSFREIFSTPCDPASRFVDQSPVTPRGALRTLQDSGAPSVKVDLLVLAEGYTAAQEPKFAADSARLLETLLATEPFARRRSDFNVRTLFVPSAEPGISNPRKGIWRDAPLACSFNAFDSDRYVLTYANRSLRELAAQAPYDTLILLVNERKYGGGGIFNLWATCTADTEPAPYVFVHEFGHSFAALADEYYSSQVAYEEFTPPGVEPWEPNVTALLDPKALKWRDLLAEGTPVPTPWRQAEYDAMDLAYQKRRAEMIAAGASEEDSERLMREIKIQSAPFLAAEPHAGKVGAFQGAAYEAKGLYRPQADCIMFTRNPATFCRVCERAVERVIDLYAR